MGPPSGTRPPGWGSALLFALLLVALSLPAGSAVASSPRHPLGSPPGGLILSAHPPSGFAPLLVAFNVTPPNGTPPRFAWSFGDGSYLNGTGKSFLTPSHVYVEPGSYDAHVTATWGSSSLNASITIDVLGSNLTVAIAASPTVGTTPLTVNFTADPTGGTGTYVAYLWNFGNGQVGSGLSFRETFAAAGLYNVTLRVTDSLNHTAVGTTAIRVNPPGGGHPPPTVVLGPLSLTTPVVLGLLAAGLVAFLLSAYWALSLRRARRTWSDPGSDPPAGVSAPPTPPPSLVPSSEDHESPSGGTAVIAASAIPASAPALELERPVRATRPALVVPGGPLPTPDSFQGRRQLTQQMIRHLASLPRLGPSDIPSAGFTQAGIAEALHVRRGAVSKVLQRLVAAGFIEVQTEHVTGGDRRVRVYRLTARGERLALVLRGERPPPRGGEPALEPIDPWARTRR
jgi:PKD repeat protein/DNA-binding MarR family transcriptional regulator